MAERETAAKADYPPLPVSAYSAPADRPLLDDGCYFLAFGQLEQASAVGTLRVRSESGRLFASGDFYGKELDDSEPTIGHIPPPDIGVPIFPIASYRHYLRVTKIEPADSGFVLTFEAHQFIANPIIPLDGDEISHWRFEKTYIARMTQSEAPSAHPFPDMFFTGDLEREDGSVFGRMQMGRVSPALRRAVIEIDRVKGSEAPEDNGAGVTWKSVFDPIGWEVTTIVGPGDVEKKDDLPWTEAEAAAALTVHRDSDDLDSEWRYHILVVPLMRTTASRFGHMYDRGTRAREDLFMSSHFVFPTTEPKWGALRGARNGETVAFFRTAVHEMGHEMGLEHNSSGRCFMRTTEDIAAAATIDNPFPSNIVWSFDPADEHRLRHWPDIAVRPGGIDMGGAPKDVA
jgi:hypothetical protein